MYVNFISIPAIMILKLIAFDDRPEKRTKDVTDNETLAMKSKVIQCLKQGILDNPEN